MMLNNQLKQAFLVLLRQGLWGRNEVEENTFPLTPDEWMQIYEMAVKQTVQGIVYDGIQLLPKEQQPPLSILIQWTVAIDQLERLNKKHLSTIHFLHQYFTQKASLPFVLLKGQANGCYYINPLHRVCGDIDLYFYHQSEKAHQLIEELGISVERETYRKGSNNANYTINGIAVDHRIRFMTLHNPWARKKLKAKQNEWFNSQEPSYLKINDSAITILSPEMNHVMQVAHILKHLITEGIGLRQCGDLVRTTFATHEQLNKPLLKEMLQTLGLYQFALVLYDLMVKQLGYPVEALPFPTSKDSTSLFNEIMESGNFGRQDERQKDTANTWLRKWYTYERVLKKCVLCIRFAPGEAFWWPVELAYNNIKRVLTK